MENHVELFELYKNGKEVQRWFTLKPEQFQYFYDMIYKQLARDNQYAKDVLQSIKDRKYRCSERQYNYLKRVIEGRDKPEDYSPRN